MNEMRNLISQMRAVTLSREYGSGGGEIAARLARRLGWQLIDHEVVVRVAQELGVSEAEAEVHDERTEGILTRIVSSMQGVDPAMLTVSPVLFTTDAQSYHRALRRVVEAAVTKGHVVIVGRGSQMLLAQRRDVLHVRVVAPLEARVSYVMRRESLQQDAARNRVQLKDRSRIRYLQAEYHISSEEAHLYDLVVNTGVLDLESVVDIAQLALERKAARLSISEQELGPGAGLSPYAGQPEDFRPPQVLPQPSE